MASTLLYKGGYETAYTALTSTEMNVASGNFGTLGSAFDNSSNKFINALAVFEPASSWTPSGGPISVWLVPSWDGGSTYEATPANLATVRQPDFTIQVMSGSSVTAKWTADGVLLKPGFQKAIIYNLTGATIPTSSTLKLYPYSTQVV